MALHLAGKPGRLLAALEEELGFDSFMDPAPKTDHGRLCPPCVAHFTAKGLEGSELPTPSHSRLEANGFVRERSRLRCPKEQVGSIAVDGLFSACATNGGSPTDFRQLRYL